MASHDYEIDQSGCIVTVAIHEHEATHLLMQEAVDTCLDKVRYDNARHFIFDLSAVEFLASACIGVLVSFLKEVEHVRGQIALANCTDSVAFLFKVTQLDSVFAIYNDAEDATDALAAA